MLVAMLAKLKTSKETPQTDVERYQMATIFISETMMKDIRIWEIGSKKQRRMPADNTRNKSLDFYSAVLRKK